MLNDALRGSPWAGPLRVDGLEPRINDVPTAKRQAIFLYRAGIAVDAAESGFQQGSTIREIQREVTGSVVGVVY